MYVQGRGQRGISKTNLTEQALPDSSLGDLQLDQRTAKIET